MSLEPLLLPLFLVNLLLVLVDASVGYHLAPCFFSATGGDPEEAQRGIRSIRRTLTLVVTLYMFFNCLAYFRHDGTLLMVVTVLVIVDLGGQLYVRHRTRRRDGRHE
ncbi:hypothetical protein [Trichlorobacter ammonificans]|uniref:Uncharacterized protein n=1 Tax=Trichlorobacter ammonificans TaxID=2916410 RepID=A0ABM9D5P9_9BACT|nr:hypothetical protein [Trichlorobacter ammonificans]CAH2030029.1 conserved membrane protein of unknown function [Trichlorobacter ammonificans]